MVAGTLTLYLRMSGALGATDFNVMWIAGRAMHAGADPYTAVRAHFPWPMNYPLPAAVLTLPFAVLPRVGAAAVWTAIGFGVLAYCLTSTAWWPLLCLANYPAVEAAQLAQWSPLVTVIGVAPAWAFLCVAKPTTAGEVTLAFLSRVVHRPPLIRALIAAGVLVLASFAIRPTWVSEWLATVRASHEFTPLVLRPGGVVLLLALVKWKRPEARLIALMALVPQAGGAYDALPLILAVTSRTEALVFACLSLAGSQFLIPAAGVGATYEAAVRRDIPVLLVSTYLPVLVMVLRRPNVWPIGVKPLAACHG